MPCNGPRSVMVAAPACHAGGGVRIPRRPQLDPKLTWWKRQTENLEGEARNLKDPLRIYSSTVELSPVKRMVIGSNPVMSAK